MNRFAPLVFACATVACGRVSERTVIASADTPGRAEAPVRGAAHGSEILAIALTEAGDSALTVDRTGALRLWPALDGTREPVPVDAPPATELALGRRDDELVAAVIDRAGIVRVLRLGRDGIVHGRAQVEGDVAAREVVAFGADLLVRRADQTIERVDADGIERGRIAARPGEQLGAIAVRGGAALVAIASGAHEAKTVRWISLGDELAWGADVELPQAIEPEQLALAPGRGRIAAAHPRIGDREPQLVVYELGKVSALPFSMPRMAVPDGASLGFASDDRVAIAGDGEVRWWVYHDKDYDPGNDSPVQRPPGLDVASPTGGAVADGVAAAAYGATLALSDPKTTHYLGWRELVTQVVTPIGDSLGYGVDEGRFLWLDDHLETVRGFDLKEVTNPTPTGAMALGDHELLVESQRDGTTHLRVVDVRKPGDPIELADYQSLLNLTYDASLHVLAAASRQDQRIFRFRIDVEPLRVTKLPPLPFDGYVYSLRLLDPAQADGVEAIVVGFDDVGQRVWVFRNGKATSKSVTNAIAGVDASGSLYERIDDKLVVRRGGKVIARIAVADTQGPAAVTRDGQRLAVVRSHGVALVDRSGHERWHHDMWGAFGVMWSGDERSLIVRTGTGLVAYDADSGETRARACGWEFGLHDSVTRVTYGQPTVCEDGER
jgi:hypothetical protein